ncbi:Guanylate cyclase soluble subunit beta-2 [Bulinus truncatus]|nr:Guanylate cyclase soluble subunit beta-2 [Bulinus truncatus]
MILAPVPCNISLASDPCVDRLASDPCVDRLASDPCVDRLASDSYWYGQIHCVIRELVITKFGEEAWRVIFPGRHLHYGQSRVTLTSRSVQGDTYITVSPGRHLHYGQSRVTLTSRSVQGDTYITVSPGRHLHYGQSRATLTLRSVQGDTYITVSPGRHLHYGQSRATLTLRSVQGDTYVTVSPERHLHYGQSRATLTLRSVQGDTYITVSPGRHLHYGQSRVTLTSRSVQSDTYITVSPGAKSQLDEHNSFLMFNRYDDTSTISLVGAVSDTLGGYHQISGGSVGYFRCSCSIIQVFLFHHTGVLVPSYMCSCSITQVFLFDHTCVLVPSYKCSCSIIQVFLFHHTDVLVPSYRCFCSITQVFLFDHTCVLVPSYKCSCSIIQVFLFHHAYVLVPSHRCSCSIIQVFLFYPTGVPVESVLEIFGEFFFDYCLRHGYDKMLRTLGSDIKSFIQNLDSLHSLLALSYKGIAAPSFRCEDGDDGELILHYYSGRPGLYPIVKGVLKAVARDLFHQSVDMSIIEQNKEDIGFNQSQEHTAFRVQLRLGDGSSTNCSERLSPDGSSCDERELVEFNPDTVLLRASDFCSAFPYHIIFDRDLRIRQCGDLIQKHSSVKMIEGTPLTHAFSIVHPKMVLSIDNIRKFINAVFLLAMVPRENGRKTMLLKGKLGAAPLHVSPSASGMSHSESPVDRTVHSLFPRRPQGAQFVVRGSHGAQFVVRGSHGAQFVAPTAARCTWIIALVMWIIALVMWIIALVMWIIALVMWIIALVMWIIALVMRIIALVI